MRVEINTISGDVFYTDIPCEGMTIEDMYYCLIQWDVLGLDDHINPTEAKCILVKTSAIESISLHG